MATDDDAADVRAGPRVPGRNRKTGPKGGTSIMGVTLAKGGNVSLSKAAPNLTQVLIGLGWDARSTTVPPSTSTPAH
ncbi:hypothetical protein SHIRM173S_08840 [Streptomyces hirsutus]